MIKVGDVLTKYDSNGYIVYQLKVLEYGTYESLVEVLDSRVETLIDKIEPWSTRLLKGLGGSEFYYAD